VPRFFSSLTSRSGTRLRGGIFTLLSEWDRREKTKKRTHLDPEKGVLFVLDRRDVLDPFPVDRRVQDLEFFLQLRVFRVCSKKVFGGHAELVVLDGDVEGRVGDLGRERGPLVEEAGPDSRRLAGLGEGERGGHGLFVFCCCCGGVFLVFFLLLKGERSRRWEREEHDASERERKRERES